MSIHLGSRATSRLGFVSAYGGSSSLAELSGYRITARGNAVADDATTQGAFKSLQRAVNSYVSATGITLSGGMLKVDGILGAKTLAATRSVVAHASERIIGYPVPGTLRQLADAATGYAVKIIWAAQQKNPDAPDFDASTGTRPGDAGGAPTTTTPAAGAGKTPPTTTNGQASNGRTTPDTTETKQAGLSPVAIVGALLLGVAGVVWYKKRQGGGSYDWGY